MKVFQIVNAPQRRGGEVFAALLTRELVNTGVDAELVSVLPAKLGAKPELEGLPVHVLAQSRQQKRAILEAAYALRKRIRKVPAPIPVVLQANIGNTLWVAVLAAAGLRGRVRLVYRNANMMSQFLRGRRSRYVLYRGALECVDLITAVSDECGDDLITHKLVPRSKVRTIENGVVLTASRRRNGQISPPQLLHVGAFVPEKNHAGLVRMFAAVLQQVPDAKLVLAGAGPFEAPTRILVNELGLKESIDFAGSVDNVEAWMKQSSLLVLPSLIEGLPGVILEAFANRLPVVANDVGAVGAVLDDGCGVALVPGDESSFVQAVVALLGDVDEQRRIADRAEARVQQRYDIRVIAEQFKQSYDALCATNGG